MSKKLIFVFILFIATLSFFIYVKVSIVKNPARFSLSQRTITPSPAPETSMSATPNQLTILSGQNASFDITLRSNAHPTLAQFELSYDPGAIFNVTIHPGSYFSGAEVALQKIDAKNGRISYALKNNEPNTLPQTGTEKILATVNFQTVQLTQTKQVEFLFMPKTSLKNDDGEIDITELQSPKIFLKPSLIVPTATPSAPLLIPQ